MTISPLTLAFGNVTKGTAKFKIWTIKNTGTGSFKLGAIVPSIATGQSLFFTISNLNTCTVGRIITPTSPCTFTVKFKPTALGTFSRNFFFKNQSGLPNQTHKATGTGISSVTTTSLVTKPDPNLLIVGAGETAGTFTVQNVGTTSVKILTVRSNNSAIIAVDPNRNFCTNAILTPGGPACNEGVICCAGCFNQTDKATFTIHPETGPDVFQDVVCNAQ